MSVSSSDESNRLDALQRLNLLDTPPSESFDRIVRMASQIFDLPIAAVSLTDSDRQWFKSRVGVEHWSIPREKAPCAQIAESGGVLVIEDFRTDPCYHDSVLGKAGVRFYAGAPLLTRDGFCLGAMCVLGLEPRVATPSEVRALQDLAAMVMAQIELQHAFGRIDPVSQLPNRTQFIDDLTDLARDETSGQQRIVVLVDLIGQDQVSHIVRAMGQGAIDEMVKNSGKTFRRTVGTKRGAYHVSTTQFATLAPDDMDVQTYVALLTSKIKELCKLDHPGRIGTLVVGIYPRGRVM